MPVHYIFGETIVERDELIVRTRVQPERTAEFAKAVRDSTTRADVTLEFSSGNVSSAAVAAQGFSELGPGKPALVMIRHLYTGCLPYRGRKDMLFSSAVKDIVSFEASPRALNILKKCISARTNVSNPAATEEGTPLVYYSPAVDLACHVDGV